MKIYNKKYKSGSLLLPLAILILLLATSTIYGVSGFIKDRINNQGISNVSYIAQSESENALVYGIYASNTPASDGGNKCTANWYDTTQKHQLVNESKLPSNVSGYTVKHYVSFNGTSDWADAQIIGYAEIYNGSKLLASKATSVRANMLYKGNGTNASSPCDAIAIKLNHGTWKHIR